MRPSPILLVAVALLGVTIALGVNSFLLSAEDPSVRATNLVELVEGLEGDRTELEQRLAALRERSAELEEQAAEEAGLRESFGSEMDAVRATAGLTDVRGSGVVVELADAQEVPLGEDPGSCLIHDFDLAAVVNTLFGAGAEAVAVNDERIVGTTAIRCAGNTVLVNSSRIGSPYTVTAVGDPGTLTDALLGSEVVGPIFDAYTVQYGLEAQVTAESELEVPAYRGTLNTRVASAGEE